MNKVSITIIVIFITKRHFLAPSDVCQISRSQPKNLKSKTLSETTVSREIIPLLAPSSSSFIAF